ncbi:MAG: LysM peptidoglycan-binding domain-containing protein, partial [Crocinitomicaceae bacterium]|nr:LysM peptidoglycan-binding domain-containing protein [Crocinitomicaceae bacterium]
MKRLICILLFAMPFLSFAQPGVASVKDVNGKRYYEHKVEAGNTLWGLSKMYGVPVDEIVSENPKLANGLKLDDVILIPVTKSSIEKIPTSDYKVKRSETLYGLSRKFKVSVDDLIELNPSLKDGLKKGQTIKVPMLAVSNDSPPKVVVDKLPADSPNPFVTDTLINEDGSKEQVAFSFSDSTIRHVVMAHETMYSVSKRFMVPIETIMKLNGLKSASVKEGQVLIIPVKNERINRVEI